MSKSNFQELLDKEHTWPDYFVFKFIIPKDSLVEINVYLPDFEVDIKPSKAGNYFSVTFKAFVQNSSEVIEIYERAQKITKAILL